MSDAANLSPEQQALVSKVDSSHSPTNPQDASLKTPEPQGFLGGKYKTAQDLEHAFKSLQAEYTKLKQGQPQQPASDPAPAQPEDATIQKQAEQAVDDAVAKGLDLDKYAKSMADNGGKLTDADYSELEQKGISRPMVDLYVKGIQAEAQARQARAAEIAGGQDAFAAARTWAAENLSEAEIVAYNEAVTKGGPAMELAVTGLVAKFRSTNPAPARVVLGSGQAPSAAGYASQREMVDAMKDVRYGRDAAYTRDVQAKAAASTGW